MYFVYIQERGGFRRCCAAVMRCKNRGHVHFRTNATKSMFSAFGQPLKMLHPMQNPKARSGPPAFHRAGAAERVGGGSLHFFLPIFRTKWAPIYSAHFLPTCLGLYCPKCGQNAWDTITRGKWAEKETSKIILPLSPKVLKST